VLDTARLGDGIIVLIIDLEGQQFPVSDKARVARYRLPPSSSIGLRSKRRSIPASHA